MRTFQILRFAEKVVNPCNSPSKQGTKKAEWRVTIRHQGKKCWDIYNQIQTHSPFCKYLIINHSQVTHEIQRRILQVSGERALPLR